MTTIMREEINQIPQACARLLNNQQNALTQAGALLRERNPAVVATIARGSSDHAAYFLKYAIELELGIPVASLGPSLASIYDAGIKLERGAAIAISQSGASPDIVAMARAARAGGGVTVSLVNTMPSALSQTTDMAINIDAGLEKAVAATKSFVNSIVAGLALIAAWKQDPSLAKALNELPAHFDAALSLDWSEMVEYLHDGDSLYMLGRGPSLAIASEAALKCKETCELHAEAYSSAEVLHGPVSLVAAQFPVLAFAARDRAQQSISETAGKLAAKRANIFLTSAEAVGANSLPSIATGHPLTDALCLIIPFYGMVEQLSLRRGLNPDQPPALQKVTVTQ